MPPRSPADGTSTAWSSRPGLAQRGENIMIARDITANAGASVFDAEISF
jgi:hypothetical protein